MRNIHVYLLFLHSQGCAMATKTDVWVISVRAAHWHEIASRVTLDVTSCQFDISESCSLTWHPMSGKWGMVSQRGSHWYLRHEQERLLTDNSRMGWIIASLSAPMQGLNTSESCMVHHIDVCLSWQLNDEDIWFLYSHVNVYFNHKKQTLRRG